MTTVAHPAAGCGPLAVKLFDEIVRETTIRCKINKAAEKLDSAGLIFIRNECFWTKEAELSVTLDAWEDYSVYLDSTGK